MVTSLLLFQDLMTLMMQLVQVFLMLLLQVLLQFLDGQMFLETMTVQLHLMLLDLHGTLEQL